MSRWYSGCAGLSKSPEAGSIPARDTLLGWYNGCAGLSKSPEKGSIPLPSATQKGV